MKLIQALFFILFTISQLALGNDRHFDMRADYLQHDNQDYLAISFKNEQGWHSYWKNPGDAGLPVKVLFDDISPKSLAWPAPHTYIQQDVLSYGYSGTYSFFYQLSQQDIKKLRAESINIKAQVLICNDICIPGQMSIDIKLVGDKVSFVQPDNIVFEVSNQVLKDSLSQLPKVTPVPSDFEVSFISSNNQLYLLYTIPPDKLNEFQIDRNLLTPYPHDLLGFVKEDLYHDQNKNLVYGVMEIAWDGEYAETPMALPSVGVLQKPLKIDLLLQNKSDIIKTKVSVNSLNQFDSNLLKQIKELPKFVGNSNNSTSNNNSSSFLYILMFALLGGLILNLMPCVLPVISIKLIGLINSRAQDKARLLKHNMSYTAGVLSTFILLAGVVHLLKSTGQQIGWGFQLQSPAFVFLVAVIIFVMALNMLGLFEFRTPGGSKLGSANCSESFAGDFFSGVVSTVLSTPCSAPFLGTALTYAFTTTAFNIYLIFVFIGIGLAMPFILVGFFPKLICFLPKPGMWMQKLKIFLGSTLILTSCWLLFILFELTQSGNALIFTFIILSSIFMAFFLKRKLKLKKISTLAVWLIPVLITSFSFYNGFFTTNKPSVARVTNASWSAWKPAVMNKEAVKFINFTAEWCLTCKVNKKLVLDTKAFYEMAKDNNIKLFEADWTNHDEVISKWLAKYNVVGVPAYFLQKESGEIIYLGETTSVTEVVNNL